MLKAPPSPAAGFVRISDRDLTEIELHSVDSIADLHRFNGCADPGAKTQAGSRSPRPQHGSSNGNLLALDAPAVCQTGYPMRRRWGRCCACCTPGLCRFSWLCVAVTLLLVALALIFYFLVQQADSLYALSQASWERKALSREVSQLLPALQELLRNLTATRGRQ
uniref:Si:dkey-20d21.12 n=1 Tax=Lepisosteus oculatus TaxID=7918 RepID=W5NAC7_LEPOC